MSNVFELIEELCPEGVEYKRLVDVSNVLYGYPFESKLFTDDSSYTPLIRIRDIKPGHPSTYYNGDYNNDFLIFKGDILVGMDGEFNLEKWKDDTPGLLNQRVCNIKSKNEEIVLNNYLFHLLKPIFNDIEKSVSGSTVKHLSVKIINSIKIPLPPLEVQAEIVRILDSFTELEAELTAELEARKKQYEYYRDSLLDFNPDTLEERLGNSDIAKLIKEACPNGVEYKRLGDIACYSKSRIDVSKVDENNYVGVENLLKDKMGKDKATSIPNSGRIIKFDKGDILIGNIRPYLRKIWLADCDGGTNGDVLPVHILDRTFVSPEYLYYVLSSEDFFTYDIKYSKGAKMPRGDKSAVLDYTFPLPPLEIQQRIASILDRFDALCNDLTSGIPAEIEARRKQYEYYRDLLLDFKQKEESVSG